MRCQRARGVRCKLSQSTSYASNKRARESSRASAQGFGISVGFLFIFIISIIDS